MNINDYILQGTGHFDWKSLLSDWTWILPPKIYIWVVNLFGDILFYTDNEELYLLSVVDGTIEYLAESRDKFADIIDRDEDLFNDIFYVKQIDELKNNKMLLKPKTCYTFKLLPVMGGEFDISNIEVMDIEVNYSLLGKFHSEIKNERDGDEI
jgi:hypothetical protein